MNEWQHLEPIDGWVSFTENDALTKALWAGLLGDDWHYLNFASGSSIWESKRDASGVQVHYEGGGVVEFAVQQGLVSEAMQLAISKFGLVKAMPPA